jgi:hypothetical protein
MSEQEHRRQFLMGASAGYTSLALALLIYSVEGALTARGWIPQRTVNPLVWLSVAVLCFFPASLSYGRMLHARQSNESTQEEAAPLSPRRLITWTILLTVAVALVMEVWTVGMEVLWHDVAPEAS